MPSIKFFLNCLLLLFLLVSLLGWLIYWKICGKKQWKQRQKRKEGEEKLLTHIHNFSPTRLKNRSWQKSIGKCRKKPKKKVKKLK